MPNCTRIEAGVLETGAYFNEYWEIVKGIAYEIRAAGVEVFEYEWNSSCHFIVGNDRIQLEADPPGGSTEGLPLTKFYLTIVPDQTSGKVHRETIEITYKIKAKLQSALKRSRWYC